jgi:hypothetical protein
MLMGLYCFLLRRHHYWLKENSFGDLKLLQRLSLLLSFYFFFEFDEAKIYRYDGVGQLFSIDQGELTMNWG